MTLRQEAYNVIDQLSDDGIKVFLDMLNKIQFLSVSGFKKSSGRIVANSSSKDGAVDSMASSVEGSDDSRAIEAEASGSTDVDFIDSLNIDDMRKMSKDEKKALFFKSGGRMKLDTQAIYDMRERSMI